MTNITFHGGVQEIGGNKFLVEDQSKESRIDENFTPIVNQDGYEQEIGIK